MRGFSAIELMVVIAIGGILVSIAWVRMAALVPIYRLEGAARDLAAELQKARGRAIAEGKCFRVALDTVNKTYQLTWASNSTCTTFPNSEPAKKIDDAGSITVTSTASPGPVFDTRGGIPTTAVITLTNTTGAARTVFAQSTGRVSVS